MWAKTSLRHAGWIFVPTPTPPGDKTLVPSPIHDERRRHDDQEGHVHDVDAGGEVDLETQRQRADAVCKGVETNTFMRARRTSEKHIEGRINTSYGAQIVKYVDALAWICDHKPDFCDQPVRQKPRRTSLTAAATTTKINTTAASTQHPQEQQHRECTAADPLYATGARHKIPNRSGTSGCVASPS